MPYSACIVDDEQLILEGLSTRIQKLNLDIILIGTAANGEEALNLYSRYHPEIFFVDITMPGMTGLELIDHIRETDPQTSTRFVIVSGYYDFAYLQKSIRLGVCDYLRKPIDEEEFRETVKKLCLEIDRSKAMSMEVPLFHGTKYLLEVAEKDFNSRNAILIRSTKLPFEMNHFLHAAESMIMNAVDFSAADNVLLVNLQHSQDWKPVVELFQRDIDPNVQCVIAEKPFQNKAALINYFDNYLNIRFFRDAGSIITGSAWASARPFEVSLEGIERDLGNFDVQKSETDVHEVFRCLVRGQSTSQFIGEYFRNIIMIIGKMYSGRNMDIPSIIRYALLPFYISRFNYIDELEQYICDLIREYCSAVTEKAGHSDLVDRVKEYIQQNYSQNISPKSVAAEFFLTPSYLTRKFSEKTKMPVGQYIENVRIQNAIRLLRITNLSITEIAGQIGYTDPSYFTRVFRKCTGLSPRDIRCKDNRTDNVAY